MFHGSPNGEIKEFAGQLSFFTLDVRVAREYAVGNIIGTQRTTRTIPTIYKVRVEPNGIIDMRKSAFRDRYKTLREELLASSTDEEDQHDYPRIDRPTFLAPRTGLPQYPFARPLLRMFGSSFDAVWVDEGSQGISLALFQPRGKVEIISVHPAV